MVDPIRQLQLTLASLSSNMHNALLQLKSDDGSDNNGDAESASAPSEHPQLPPFLHELDKLKGQLNRSCIACKSKCVELQMHAGRQMRHFQSSLQETAQKRLRQSNRPSGQRPRRRRTNRGLHLVNAVESPAPVSAKVGGSSSASSVGASKNALAGGLAGGLVALSLYPVDTIKTLVQAQTGAGQRSIPRIFQKLMEKHGEGNPNWNGWNYLSTVFHLLSCPSDIKCRLRSIT